MLLLDVAVAQLEERAYAQIARDAEEGDQRVGLVDLDHRHQAADGPSPSPSQAPMSAQVADGSRSSYYVLRRVKEPQLGRL